MRKEEKIQIFGVATLRLTRGTSTEVIEWKEKNLLVDSGLNLIATYIASTGTITNISHMAMGDGTTIIFASQTSLVGTELERVTTASQSAVGAVVNISAQFGPTLTATVAPAEFGIFNAAVGGNMLNRFTTAIFTMDNNDLLDVDWQLTIAG